MGWAQCLGFGVALSSCGAVRLAWTLALPGRPREHIPSCAASAGSRPLVVLSPHTLVSEHNRRSGGMEGVDKVNRFEAAGRRTPLPRLITRWLGMLLALVAVMGLVMWVALLTRLTVSPRQALANGEAMLEHRRVLVVVAHPDDADWWIAGTLRRFVEEGAEVMLVVASNGEKGPNRNGAQNLAEARREEQRAAQQVIGYQLLVFLEMPDREVARQPELPARIREIAREFKPTLVITFDPRHPELPYLHPDHEGVGRVVREWWMREGEGVAIAFFHSRRPDAAVDISDVYDLKREALQQHRSQGLGGAGSINQAAHARNGRRVGVPLAELFRFVEALGKG